VAFFIADSSDVPSFLDSELVKLYFSQINIKMIKGKRKS